MTIQIDVFWLVGLIAVLLSYRPVAAGAISAIKTAVTAYRFAQGYVDLPARISTAESDLHGLELRVDDLEGAVFPSP